MPNSLGEVFINNQNGGAVAYIGASNISYEDCNTVLVSGNLRKAILNPNSIKYYPGMIGSLYHDISMSDIKYKVRTVGGMLQAGFRAYRYCFNDRVAEIDIAKYSTEIYNLLGDPTYMPYTDTPKEISFNYSGNAQIGRNFEVKTAPEAQVAITQKGANDEVIILAAGMATEDGRVVLTIDSKAVSGKATLYAIAPNYICRSREIDLTNADSTERSSNANLSKITIKSKAYDDIAINITSDEIICAVLYEQNPITISAITSDNKANIFGDGMGTFSLQQGENIKYITVTAENGTTKTYTLKITRKATTRSKDYNINTLKIDGVVVQPRATDRWYYDYKLNGETQLKLEVVMNNSNAKCWIQSIRDADESDRQANAKNTLTETVDIAELKNAFGNSITIRVMSEFADEVFTFTVKLN